ncbi:MAG TPA: FAD-binding oxidoreductase [Mycobacteriales bacterium]|jgi:glycolate oxidase FAD binding subunit
MGTPEVSSPVSTEETAAVLRDAAARGLAVVARGTGTKQSWGAPPSRVDLILDTTRLDRVLEHAAGDLIVRAQAGVTLAALGETLAPAGQRLALDPLYPGTLGGMVATAGSGPLRYSHGAVRDLLIGITFVRADGVVAKAGGKVVKNVAGYDLGKLFAGSWGTLGVITEVTFRLHPLPAVSRWVVVPADGDEHTLVQAVVHSRTVPSAVELDRPAGDPATLAVLVEGTEAGVAGRVETLRDLLGEDAAVRESAPDWWGQPPPGESLLRLTHEIAGLPRLLGALDAAAARHGARAAVRGSAGVGLLHASVPGDAVGAVVADLRAASSAWGGDVVVLEGPSGVDKWGPVRGLDLMRRLKDQFDPGHRLAPGRFVGGI